jgi:hypothetical protein
LAAPLLSATVTWPHVIAQELTQSRFVFDFYRSKGFLGCLGRLLQKANDPLFHFRLSKSRKWPLSRPEELTLNNSMIQRLSSHLCRDITTNVSAKHSLSIDQPPTSTKFEWPDNILVFFVTTQKNYKNKEFLNIWKFWGVFNFPGVSEICSSYLQGLRVDFGKAEIEIFVEVEIFKTIGISCNFLKFDC